MHPDLEDQYWDAIGEWALKHWETMWFVLIGLTVSVMLYAGITETKHTHTPTTPVSIPYCFEAERGLAEPCPKDEIIHV